MKWTNIRQIHPGRWVLVEALSAKSLDNHRHIEDMSVLSEFQDTKDAWNAYKEHHLSEPNREYYIFHTSNETLEVLEQHFTGVRGRQ